MEAGWRGGGGGGVAGSVVEWVGRRGGVRTGGTTVRTGGTTVSGWTEVRGGVYR